MHSPCQVHQGVPGLLRGASDNPLSSDIYVERLYLDPASIGARPSQSNDICFCPSKSNVNNFCPSKCDDRDRCTGMSRGCCTGRATTPSRPIYKQSPCLDKCLTGAGARASKSDRCWRASI